MNRGEARVEKRCARCGGTKPLAEFGVQMNGKTPRGYCLPCQSNYVRDWQRANPERYAQQKQDALVRHAKTFSIWKLDGALSGLFTPYMRAVYADPCSYCGAMGRDGDHIFPIAKERIGKQRSKASAKEWQNLTSACQRCNVKKGRQTLLEFLGWPMGWLS